MKAYLNHIKMTCSHLKAKGLKTDSSSSLEVCIAFQNPFVFPLPKLKSQENNFRRSKYLCFYFHIILDKFWVHSSAFPYFSSKYITLLYRKLPLFFPRRNYTSMVKIYENERRKTMYQQSSYSFSLLTNIHKNMITILFLLVL